MGKDTKIVHVVVVDGEADQIKAIQQLLTQLKVKLNFEAEFIITNDKIQFRDAKYLLEELYELIKRGKK